ncbi:MAG: hypothetical protein ACPGR1_07700, partial [Candidatus Poseidoniaceae archaeon]
MQDHAGSDEGVRVIEADEDGSMKFRIIFDDSHEPTLGGGEFRAAIKIGHQSVYLLWDVNVKADPEYVKEQKKLEAERKKAEKEAEQAEAKAAKEAKAAEEKAAKEAKAAEEKAAKAAASEKKKSAKSVKEVQKQEELKRVKERAKTIDFKVIGVATTTELKSEVKKGAKTLEVGNASEFDESGSAAITDSEGSS